MKKFGLSVIMSLSLIALVLSGCTTEQLATIEAPTDLAKEIEIDNTQIEAPNVNIEDVRKRLATKPVIPEKRETSDLKDPFILKSLKALKISVRAGDEKQELEKQEEKKEEQQLSQAEVADKPVEQKERPVNIAEESPMMFNFEGLSISAYERRAILRHLVNNRAYIVKIGDIVGGYTVSDITDDSLILIKGSEKLVITKKKK